MSEDFSTIPPDILARVKLGSQAVAHLATQLSGQIASFDAWLNQLPGKVEAQCFGAHPSDRTKCLVLGYGRSTKGGWSLLVASVNRNQDGSPAYMPTTLEPLADMALEIKQSAIKLFPELLKNMLDAQAERTVRLKTATTAFDEFEQSIGLKGGK